MFITNYFYLFYYREEHVSHARGKCKFLRYANTYETEISLKKFMELEIERHKNIEVRDHIK